MGFRRNFHECSLSALPIVILVLVLGVTIAPLRWTAIMQFFLGAVLLVVGLSIFLKGVEVGITPMGHFTGSALIKRGSVPLLLGAAFITGFFVTIAEPDVQVLATQFSTVAPNVNKLYLVLAIALGVGIFVAIGLLRLILRVPLQLVFLASYIVVFILAYMIQEHYLGISFDSGGATTGPMTVPFIMSLGIGVANSVGEKNTFGLTGIASIGPILSVLLFALSLNKGELPSAELGDPNEASVGLAVFIRLFPIVLREVLSSLFPLVMLFIVFELLLLKLPPVMLAKTFVGIFYSFVGLVIFLLGVQGGFMGTGEQLGKLMVSEAIVSGLVAKALLVLVGLLLGALTVCAEPAVYVLTAQVEEISGGAIKRRLMLICLAIGISLAVAISLVRLMLGFSLWYILLPGYVLALLLAFICPPLFVGIAFDAGGVASGPMTSTFILSFVLGTSKGDSTGAFGLIALVALAPLITIQLLGLIYNVKATRTARHRSTRSSK